MSLVLALPFLIQGVAHFIDEFYFHRGREPLPRWELWSHPVDTLGVLITYSVCLFAPMQTFWLVVFGVLFLFSCFSITKDEWVHQQHCSAGEQWLHSVLFVIHPIVLFLAGLYGLSRFRTALGYEFLQAFEQTFWVLQFFAFATLLVFFIQIVKGGLAWRAKLTQLSTQS